MNAIVSASAGRAIVIDDEQFFSIESGDLSTLVPRSARDVRFLVGERRDLVFLERVTVDDVRARLDEALRHDDALRWTLSLLDGDLKESTRVALAKAAEEVLDDHSTRDFVEAVLCGQPVPPDLDPRGAERIAAAEGCAHVARMLSELRARHSIVEGVHEAWQSIPTKAFGTSDDRERARAAVVREGLFREVVKALADGKAAGAVLASALMSPRIRVIPHHRDFLQRWARHLPKQTPPPPPQPEPEEPDSERDLGERDQPGGSGRQRLVGHAAWQRVEAQQAGILEALRRRNLDAARKQMAELVDFQVRNREPRLVVKSLCNMAVQAQRRGLIALQDEWTADAVRIGPSDGWAWTQRGKALLDLGRTGDALDAYDQAERYTGNVVARTGRAEVLKAMGRFDEALRAYDSALQHHPDNVVARNGRAEVLKAMGRFDEALRAYDDTLRHHPDDVFARTGRASVLVLVGKSKEAMRALPEVAPGTLDHWIVEHIRGTILLRSGKVDEAIRLLEIGARDCDFAVSQSYFRTALAIARLRQRQYAAAAEVLAELAPDRSGPITHLLNVHALGELKQFEEAAAASNRVSPTLPDFLEKLRRELDDRYVRRTGPNWTDDEVFRAEIQRCLLAA